MKHRNFLSICLAASLTVGLTGCFGLENLFEDNRFFGDDDEQTSGNPQTPNDEQTPNDGNDSSNDGNDSSNEGNDLSNAPKDLETQLSECYYAEAYESLNATYLEQVESDNIDAQTAFSRSFLGLIHLAYRPEIQAILPKLGFIQKNGIVDFKPLWDSKTGIFTGKSDDDEWFSLLPIHGLTEDSEISWEDAIDKTMTADEVVDALVKLKPELESLAESFEAAAQITGTNPVSFDSNIGCGLNVVQMDAADLRSFAAVLMVASAAIDLVSKYDFNFSLYDAFIKDIYVDDEEGSLIDGVCKVSELERPAVDECKKDLGKDYQDLICYDIKPMDYLDSTYLYCAVPAENAFYETRKSLADKIIPHLFRQTTSSREVLGMPGATAFQKGISLFLEAMNGDAKGVFFDYASIPDGALQDMKDIATEIANGTGLLKFITPNITLDLNKLFNEVVYAQDGDITMNLTPRGTSTIINGVWGDQKFLYVTLPNHAANAKFLTYTSEGEKRDNYYDESQFSLRLGFRWGLNLGYRIYFENEDAWERFSLDNWLNPHGYFY